MNRRAICGPDRTRNSTSVAMIASSRTGDLLASGSPPSEALTSGFQRALLASSITLAVAAVIALRSNNTRGETESSPGEGPADLEPAPVLSGSAAGAEGR